MTQIFLDLPLYILAWYLLLANSGSQNSEVTVTLASHGAAIEAILYKFEEVLALVRAPVKCVCNDGKKMSDVKMFIAATRAKVFEQQVSLSFNIQNKKGKLETVRRVLTDGNTASSSKHSGIATTTVTTTTTNIYVTHCITTTALDTSNSLLPRCVHS